MRWFFRTAPTRRRPRICAARKASQRRSFPSKGRAREDVDAAIDLALRAHNIELVALAGFMRILTPGFVAKWQGRMINIHPSLLPEFKGLDTHERALAAGKTEHGCTVHYVSAELDAGEIIAQARVPVLAGDDAHRLAERVLAEEHKLYPRALAEVARNWLAPSGKLN